MSLRATFSDGVFKPIDDAKEAIPGKTYRVFSEEEFRALTEQLRENLAKGSARTDVDEATVYDNP